MQMPESTAKASLDLDSLGSGNAPRSTHYEPMKAVANTQRQKTIVIGSTADSFANAPTVPLMTIASTRCAAGNRTVAPADPTVILSPLFGRAATADSKINQSNRF